MGRYLQIESFLYMKIAYVWTEPKRNLGTYYLRLVYSLVCVVAVCVGKILAKNLKI